MRPVTEREIRTSFVNCSKGEAKRLAVPKDLATHPWDDLDFLGWRDPSAPDRAYLVVEDGDGLLGVALRRATPPAGSRRSMCALCLTTHSGDGVSLMTARKAGKAGQQGNSVGSYLCADLACSLYVRGKKETEPGARAHDSLPLDQQITRTMANLRAFLDRVTRG
ncbi:FBP domain-containing protein [Actinophytocola sp. KF-1]